MIRIFVCCDALDRDVTHPLKKIRVKVCYKTLFCIRSHINIIILALFTNDSNREKCSDIVKTILINTCVTQHPEVVHNKYHLFGKDVHLFMTQSLNSS